MPISGSFTYSSRLPNIQCGRETLCCIFPILKCLRMLCRIHGSSFQFDVSAARSLGYGNIHPYLVNGYFCNLDLNPCAPYAQSVKVLALCFALPCKGKLWAWISLANLLWNICASQKSCQRALPGGGVGQSNGFCRHPGNKVFDILKLKVCVLHRTFLRSPHLELTSSDCDIYKSMGWKCVCSLIN